VTKRQRLDQLLVERGLAQNRARAQALILAGSVFSGKTRLEKAGHQVNPDMPVKIQEKLHPWVSRGGLKLKHALDYFSIKVEGLICLDIGSSTGGFTDVLLHSGAAKVYAIDVGRGQLDWKLRKNPRVVVMEGVNARYLVANQIDGEPSLVVCDTSFIGLKTVLPAALKLTSHSSTLIALIKPQFEVGKGRVGKGGVVRDPDLHHEVCKDIENWLNFKMGWSSIGITESPVKGPKGNKEFLIAALNYAYHKN